MTDYPDFTYRGNVDIIAQTISKIAVDITTQTLAALKVNITAQGLAQLVIKIAAQTVGVYLQPEWSALEGEDKTLIASGTGKGWHEFATVTYTPTAPKTLYINAIGFNSQIETEADYDHFAHVQVSIFVAASVILTVGGETGGSLVLPRPIVVAGGEELIAIVSNNSGIDCAIAATLLGYEV